MVSFNYGDNDSLFHSITQLHLSKEQLDSILRTCGGHPLTLDYVYRVATQDLSLTTDVNKTPSGADYDDVISLLLTSCSQIRSVNCHNWNNTCC